MDTFISESEWEIFSDSGSSDDQEEIEYLYGGQASFILSNLEETIDKIDEFLSFERGFMPGDIVRYVSDPSGQMGLVVERDMLADLENNHGKLLKGVNSRKLLQIRSISVGDLVVCASWVGRVMKIIDCVTVLFDDGAKCEIIVMDRKKLLPISPNILEDSQYPYYPGQRVKVQSTVSTSAKWLCGTWKDKQDEGTIVAIDAGFVCVDWLTTCNSSVSSPRRWQNAKSLTLLSGFPQGNWQIGDCCLLPIEVKNNMTKDDFFNGSTHELLNGIEKLEFDGKNHCAASGEIFVIVQTKTKIVVLWQDGSRSLGLDSKNLLPTSAVNAHEFWPEQFVLEKIDDDPLMSSSQRWGVVQSVDAKEQTVKVQWKNLNLFGMGNLYLHETVEMTSSYELINHPEYSFSLGDVVFKLSQNEFMRKFHQNDVNSDCSKGEQEVVLQNNSRDKDQSKPMNNYLSYIGIVTGFTNGTVEVNWADCSTTKVEPYEIFRVDKYEDSTTTTIAYQDNLDGLSQELKDSEKGVLGMHSWDSCACFLPQAAIGFFSNIASIFGLLGATSPSTAVSSCRTSEDFNGPTIFHDELVESCDHLVTETNAITDLQEATADWEDEEILENKDLTLSKSSENCHQYKQFQIAPDCPRDHHFINSGKCLALSQMQRSWLKKVRQEWSIFEKNHPETIYVQVFEERMDLIRAAIVGAPGTPYHDCLFFFDICLPPAYPQDPPLVHYISGGLRINPNLYESGKVCLSLLNTWAGSTTEVWNPESSTILQVLLSLQALVLNAKPYFNEAGYDVLVGRADGEKNSVSYNENAFVLTCKTMLHLLRKPPKHFEELVKEHFIHHSEYILMACKAYMQGAPIGYPCGYSVKDHENQNATSTGFKMMLSKIYPKLEDAFSGLKKGQTQRFV